MIEGNQLKRFEGNYSEFLEKEKLKESKVKKEASKKIGHYLPGTLIPVVHDSVLFEHQPDFALFLAWHIADELRPKLRKLGYRGKFIVPLPEPHILE